MYISGKTQLLPTSRKYDNIIAIQGICFNKRGLAYWDIWIFIQVLSEIAWCTKLHEERHFVDVIGYQKQHILYWISEKLYGQVINSTVFHHRVFIMQLTFSVNGSKFVSNIESGSGWKCLYTLSLIPCNSKISIVKSWFPHFFLCFFSYIHVKFSLKVGSICFNCDTFFSLVVSLGNWHQLQIAVYQYLLDDS